MPVKHPGERPAACLALFVIGSSGRKQVVTTPEAIIDLDDSDEVGAPKPKRKGKINHNFTSTKIEFPFVFTADEVDNDKTAKRPEEALVKNSLAEFYVFA